MTLILQTRSFQEYQSANRLASKWLLYLLPCSSPCLFLIISTFCQFHSPPPLCSGLVGGEGSSLSIRNKHKNKTLRGTSLGVLCICWWVVRVVVSDGPWERSVLWGHDHKGLPTLYDLRRSLVQLSWSGAPGKPSLTLSLTPKPASTENSASPGLSHHSTYQLGSDCAQNNQHPWSRKAELSRPE